MLLDAICGLDDPALGWLAWFAIKDSPGTPRAEAPAFWRWLEDAAAFEQARRAGCADGPGPTFPALDAEALYSAARSAVAFYDAQKIAPQVAAKRGYPFTAEERRVRDQLEALFRTTAGVLLAMAAGPTAH
jgi:hypothetical protein